MSGKVVSWFWVLIAFRSFVFLVAVFECLICLDWLCSGTLCYGIVTCVDLGELVQYSVMLSIFGFLGIDVCFVIWYDGVVLCSAVVCVFDVVFTCLLLGCFVFVCLLLLVLLVCFKVGCYNTGDVVFCRFWVVFRCFAVWLFC